MRLITHVRWYGASLCCVMLVGCAAQQPRGSPKYYVPSSICAETISAVPVRAIESPDKQGMPPKVAVDAQAACLRDKENNAKPILLFSLAGLGIPVELQIATSGSGETTFAPLIRVLDADFAEQARYQFEEFHKRGTDYSLTVFLNNATARPTYLAITPDTGWLGKDNLTVAGKSRTTVWSTGTVMGAITTGSEEKMHSTFSDIGELTLLAKPYAPANQRPQ